MARMPAEQEQAILDLYEAWDPRNESTEALVARSGVTRTSFYNVLHRNGVTLKTRATATAALPPEVSGALLPQMARLALDDVYRAQRVAELRAAALEAAIRTHPRCRHHAELVAVLDQ